MADIFKLVGSIFIDNDKANDSLSKTEEKAGGVGGALVAAAQKAGQFAIGLGAATVAASAAIYKVAETSAKASDEIDKMSQKIGISREAYQEMAFACSQSGTDVNKLQAGMKTLRTYMDKANEGGKEQTAIFQKLGVAVADSSGNLRDQETVMFETMSALSNVTNETEKARLATQLFGKSGTELLPLLNSGADSIDALREKAHELGLVIDDETVDAGVKLTDTIDQVKRSFSAIVTRLGGTVMPLVQNALDVVISGMPKIQEVASIVFGAVGNFVEKAWEVISTVLSSVRDAFAESGISITDAVSGVINFIYDAIGLCADIWNTVGQPIINLVGGAVQHLAETFGINFGSIAGFVSSAFDNIANFWNAHLKPVFDSINAFLANVLAPVFQTVFDGIIGPVVTAVFNSIGGVVNNVMGVLGGLCDFVSNVFSLNFTGAFQSIVDVVGNIFGALGNVVKMPVNAVINIINGLIDGLNTLKIPDWVPLLGGKGIDIPKIPLLAKGGNVVGGGSAIVGEAGAELINLPQGASVTPLTNGQKDVLGTDEIKALLGSINNELQEMNSEIYGKIVRALVDGTQIDWNDRELARLVRKYA